MKYLEEDGIEHFEPIECILLEAGEPPKQAVTAIGLFAIFLCLVLDDMLDKLQLLLKLFYEDRERSL